MNTIKLITRIAGSIVLVFLVLLSCKKEQNQTPPEGNGTPGTPLPACSENSGYFTIDVNGEHFELVIDSATQYTNLYNWYGEQESAFIIYGKDQNSSNMQIELGLPGKFNLGSTSYSTDSLDFDFFDIFVDTFDLYVSNVVFNVTTSILDTDGIYKPLKASFTGLAHSYPWINGQAPADTINISGTICLNGYILN